MAYIYSRYDQFMSNFALGAGRPEYTAFDFVPRTIIEKKLKLINVADKDDLRKSFEDASGRNRGKIGWRGEAPKIDINHGIDQVQVERWAAAYEYYVDDMLDADDPEKQKLQFAQKLRQKFDDTFELEFKELLTDASIRSTNITTSSVAWDDAGGTQNPVDDIIRAKNKLWSGSGVTAIVDPAVADYMLGSKFFRDTYMPTTVYQIMPEEAINAFLKVDRVIIPKAKREADAYGSDGRIWDEKGITFLHIEPVSNASLSAVQGFFWSHVGSLQNPFAITEFHHPRAGVKGMYEYRMDAAWQMKITNSENIFRLTNIIA